MLKIVSLFAALSLVCGLYGMDPASGENLLQKLKSEGKASLFNLKNEIAKDGAVMSDSNQNNLLHTAIELFCSDEFFSAEISSIVDYLLLNKASDFINTFNKEGKSPFFLLIEKIVSLRALKETMKKGSSSQTICGKKIIFLIENITQFMRNGANPTELNKDGINALSFAAINQRENSHKNSHNDYDILKLIINFGIEASNKNIIDAEFFLEEPSQGAKKGAKNAHKGEKSTPLLWSICYNWQEGVKNLVEVGASLEVKDANGNTPLINAVTSGYIDFYKLLKESGANLHCTTSDGKTLLHIAAGLWNEIKRLALCQKIINDGIAINARDSKGQSALHLAAAQGYHETCKLLVKEGADVNLEDNGKQTPFHLAVAESSLEKEAVFIKVLEELASTTFYNLDVNLQDSKGQSIVHLAAAKGYANMLDMILCTDDLEVDLQDNKGRTPLFLASNYKIAELLLNKGANPLVKDKKGQTAMDYQRASYESVRSKSSFGSPPRAALAAIVDYALEKKQKPVINYLLNFKEKIGGKDVDCTQTLLHWAVESDRGVFFGLIDEGTFNLNEKDIPYYRTPLHYVMLFKEGDCIFSETLLDKGADPNIQDSEGKTPLHYLLALPNPPNDTCELFYKRGDFLLKDKDGLAPISYIMKKASSTGQMVAMIRMIFSMNKDHLAKIVNQKIPVKEDGASSTVEKTLLHCAIENRLSENQQDLCKELFEANADPNSASGAGKRPIHIVVQELLAIKEPHDSKNLTAEESKATNRMQALLEVIDLLREKGADFSRKDDHGKTAADYCPKDESRLSEWEKNLRSEILSKFETKREKEEEEEEKSGLSLSLEHLKKQLKALRKKLGHLSHSLGTLKELLVS